MYYALHGAECEDLCTVTVFYMGLNVRSTASTITSITYDALSIRSDVITQQQQQYVCLRILQCTHTPKAYEFIVLWSAFITSIYMYVANHSHWSHLYLTSPLRFYCNESRGSDAKSQQRGVPWMGLPYSPKTDRGIV